MATTTNFGWETPDDTDLVKDGAAAIRTALGGVDTSFVDLKGGTTGQVLAKASGTDLDFSWVAVDPLTILDAKGDLISATAADTPARLAVGTNGQILTADSTASTGLAWATPAPAISGLTLIKTQTIGSGVSSVNVTSAFNSTYDNYRIIVSGGVASTNNQFALTLGATATGYYTFGIYGAFNSSTVTGQNTANTPQWGGCGGGTTNSLNTDIILQGPNLAKNTMVRANWGQTTTTGQVQATLNGYLANTTQYTDFTLTPNTGTLTGGTIRVYGFQNS
jgi:hypothetical protein